MCQPLRCLWQTKGRYIFPFISKCQLLNSFPSGVAPKSLHLADLCLPPVIQCSVLDGLQELVHIIPQHAASEPRARVRSQVCCCHEDGEATGEVRRSNTLPPEAECLRMGGWSSLVMMMCLSVSHESQVLSGCIFEADRWLCSLLVLHSLPSVNFTGGEKKPKKHKTLACALLSFSIYCTIVENGGIGMTSPPDWGDGE